MPTGTAKPRPVRVNSNHRGSLPTMRLTNVSGPAGAISTAALSIEFSSTPSGATALPISFLLSATCCPHLSTVLVGHLDAGAMR